MATFVLVHGGGHGGWCWDRVAPLLRAAGHTVHTPTLTGLAERAGEVTAQTNLSTHIRDVTDLFDAAGIERAILVGHSYGGMVITGAADRLRGRIARLVYLDATHPRSGQGLVDTMPSAKERLMQGVEVVNGVAMTLLPSRDTIGIVYGLSAPEDIDWALAHLTPHPLATVIEPLVLEDEAAVLALPRASIDCARTLALRTPELRARIASCEPRFVLDTGHDAMITAPAEVARILLGLA